MSGLVFILICTFIPSILTQCTVEKAEPSFKRSVYEYSINLMTRLAQEKELHFVSSTLSSWILLSCTSFGAADKTLAELKQVLKLHQLKCFNHKYLEIANTVGINNDTDVIVERSSTIFVDDKMPIFDEFKRKITTTGVSNFENLPFDNSDAAAQRINDYVNQATHGIIDEIVTPADIENVLIIIIDAIFFKGSWKVPFSYEETEVTAFYNERGTQIGDVNMMYLSGSFKFRSIKQIKAIALELPYGSGERYSMILFLPFKDVSLYTVVEELKQVSLKTIQILFDEFGPDRVFVQIPRFKITSDLNNLKELLEDMGLKAMFDSHEARFPNLSEYPLYVSNFIQKADIEVTEEGTVAAVVTEAELSFRSSPDQFTANKPFLFMIIDKLVEVPIFVGAYSKPSVY